MRIPLIDPVRRTKGRGRTLAFLLTATALAMASFNPVQSAAGEERGAKPTIVLVHGSWADASSWNRVTERLQDDGYTVRAISNNLRSVAGDAASVRAFLQTLTGPVVLVGHSYGGFVITNAATGLPNVKALVYINAFAPDTGETPSSSWGRIRRSRPTRRPSSTSYPRRCRQPRPPMCTSSGRPSSPRSRPG